MGFSQHACVLRETLEINPETILRKILTKKFGKKNLKKFWEKNFLIHIIARKIPRGVLATRVCLARNPRNKSRNNFEENFDKKIWKKNWKKNSGKKNFLIHIITRKIPRGVLATRVCLARNPRNKSRNNFEENFDKKFGKKNLKKFWEKKFSHSYNREKNPAWGSRNTRVSRAKPSK